MRNVDGVPVVSTFLRGLLLFWVEVVVVVDESRFFFFGDGVSLARVEDVDEAVRPRRGVRICNESFGDSSSAGSSNGVSPMRRSRGTLSSMDDWSACTFPGATSLASRKTGFDRELIGVLGADDNGEGGR